MQIQKTQIKLQPNFKAGIKVVKNGRMFEHLTSGFEYVGRPWTVKEIKNASKIFTEGVQICTSGGIISQGEDGLDVVMFHINPTQFRPHEIDAGFDNIKEVILSKLGEQPSISGILLGSKSYLRESGEIFSKFVKFMKELKIPFSEFKGIRENLEDVGLAFNGENNCWTIFPRNWDGSEHGLEKSFDRIIINPVDCLYNIG